MEFTKLISTRYSVRAYSPRPVEDHKLQRILEAACLAPTADNRQPFRLIVCSTEGRNDALAQVYHREWFSAAPLVIVACGVLKEAWVRQDGKSYLDVDVAIVMDHLILAAANEGLGTCWVANFNSQQAREIFFLPENVEPVVLTPLGYPADEPKLKERKEVNLLVYNETWGGTIHRKNPSDHLIPF